MLNPFNCALRWLPLEHYRPELRKYRAYIQTRFGFVVDAHSGQRLNIEEQCVPVELVSAVQGSSLSTSSAAGHNYLMKMAESLEQRERGYHDVHRTLITAEAASGKVGRVPPSSCPSCNSMTHLSLPCLR